MIRWISDYSDVDRELDRLIGMPTPKTVAGLEAVLTIGFKGAQADVHVDTGALKGSGEKKSSTTASKWEGQFSFGKPSAGVDYAIYEKERDGGHDFMKSTVILHSLFLAAVVKGLSKK